MRGIRRNSSATRTPSTPAASSALDPRQDRVSLCSRSERLSTARRISNVWVLIWPNQKKILGIVTATDEEKAKARRVAFLASRTNTMLSIPMLFMMVASGGIFRRAIFGA